MKGFIAIALMASFALAGCLGDGESTSTSTSKAPTTSASKTGTSTAPTTMGPTTSGTTTATTTSTTSPPTERTHTATLTASVRNGTAPLNVTFTLAATNLDAQTTWTLAFGDGASRNGTALPASATHRYNTTGTKTAQATVRFGDGKTATASLTIAVLSSGAGGPLVNKTFTTTIPIPKPVGTGAGCGTAPDPNACTANQLAALNENGANETFFVWYDVTVPAGAKSILALGGSQETQDCTAGCSPDFDLYLYAPDGTVTVAATDAAWETAAPESAPAAGTWSVALVYYLGPPEGAATIQVVVH